MEKAFTQQKLSVKLLCCLLLFQWQFLDISVQKGTILQSNQLEWYRHKSLLGNFHIWVQYLKNRSVKQLQTWDIILLSIILNVN